MTTVDGEPVPGTSVAGWSERGPSGGIGASRSDAEETVEALLAYAAAGLVGRPHVRR